MVVALAIAVPPCAAVTLTPLGFRPEALNSSGHVVGWDTELPQHAVSWDNGRVERLPELSGFRSRALAVNDAGTAVGYIETSAGAKAALWTAAGATLLPSPATGAVAEAINNHGTIGGLYYNTVGTEHPVVWVGGILVELASLGGSQSLVSDINDAGVATGSSTRPMAPGMQWSGMASRCVN